MRVYALVHLNACSFPKHKPLAPSYVHFCEVPLKPKSSAPNPKCETRRSGIALFTQSRPKPVCLEPNQSVAAVHFSIVPRGTATQQIANTTYLWVSHWLQNVSIFFGGYGRARRCTKVAVRAVVNDVLKVTRLIRACRRRPP